MNDEKKELLFSMGPKDTAFDLVHVHVPTSVMRSVAMEILKAVKLAEETKDPAGFVLCLSGEFSEMTEEIKSTLEVTGSSSLKRN